MKVEDHLYKEMDLSELEEYLNSFPKNKALNELTKAFYKYSTYKNLQEWNKAVRLCESLTILGWKELIPVEAHKSRFFNGNPYTGFYDKNGEERYQSAIWSKRKSGFTIEPERTYQFTNTLPTRAVAIKKIKIDIQNGKFNSQRNWIGKNPIRPYIYLMNAFPELKYIQGKIGNLKEYLDEELNGSDYGNSFNYFSISCNISSPFTEYIIIPESGNVKKGNNNMKINTPKFKFNRFTKKNGTYSIDYYISKEFGIRDKRQQVDMLKNDFIYMCEFSSKKLKPKCVGYNFSKLQEDLKFALKKWN